MTLVITDPCYLSPSKPLMEDSTLYGDWSCMVYPGKLEESTLPNKWWERYLEFLKKTYNSRGEIPEENDLIEKEKNDFLKFKGEWKKNILGEFCADSGAVAIFNYEELTEKEKTWVKEHPWCATIIEDFTGSVKFYDSNKDTRHIIGEGNKPFFSIQSGF